MGFFDICNDDPNLTSGNYSTTQRGNNGRSYNSNYYSTLRFPYAPVETPNGIYAFYKDPRHVFYFDKDRFGEFYIYRDRIKILYVGRITRDYNNVFTVFGNDSEEYTNFFDFDKAISALKDDELGELFIYIRNGEIVFRFAAGEAPHDVQIKRFANNIVTYGYKSSCRRVPYANILDYLVQLNRSDISFPPVQPIQIEGIYPFYNNPAHAFYIDENNHFGEFYFNKDNMKFVKFGDVVRYNENAYIAFYTETKGLWGADNFSYKTFFEVMHYSDREVITKDNDYENLVNYKIILIYAIPKGLVCLFDDDPEDEDPAYLVSQFCKDAYKGNFKPLCKKSDISDMPEYHQYVIDNKLYKF